jgi:hypothetical protein
MYTKNICCCIPVPVLSTIKIIQIGSFSLGQPNGCFCM